MNRHRSSRGFTLIELLVVLAVMMVLAFLTMPMLLEAIESSKLRGITQGTVSLMRLARYEAIKKNACGLVQLDTASGLLSSYLDQDCNTATGNRLLGTQLLPSGITATSTLSGDLVFQGDGSANVPPEGREFSFVNRKGAAKTVSVARTTGKISVL
ncbi:MAG TPA: GspH/FimT family pseudopilin [Thermoanaerobaculia bacterium]|nr:GspH/FimT family pseudopilin [Thermoanaerobaculia bacterium]